MSAQPQLHTAPAEDQPKTAFTGPSDLELSALLASRLCHDLVNPVGALAAGLEVLDSEPDQEMQDEAKKLINMSTEKSVALLTFARLAFGAGGAFGAEIDMGEVRNAVESYYSFIKADLVWQLDVPSADKNFCKIIMNLSLFAGDCVPRDGSTVTISGDRREVVIRASGPRARLKETLVAALEGNGEGLEAKMAPAYIAGRLSREMGGEIACDASEEETVLFRISFPAAAA